MLREDHSTRHRQVFSSEIIFINDITWVEFDQKRSGASTFTGSLNDDDPYRIRILILINYASNNPMEIFFRILHREFGPDLDTKPYRDLKLEDAHRKGPISSEIVSSVSFLARKQLRKFKAR